MARRQKVNILLVDDQPSKLLAYEAMLAELDENLIKAGSGKEALDRLLRFDIPIVLMDVSMPDLDGFELAALIREHPRHQKTAIIFVSAVHLSDTDRLQGYRSGAVDYVSVPVIPELLRAKVRVFAELHRRRRESEQLNMELEARVAERTAALREAAAKQAELTEELRQASHRKDEFLAFLGHELRNPLAPIINATRLMHAKVIEDQDLVWCRDVIERQAAQLTRLVDDLLDVSRITRGTITLRSERVDVASVVANAVESCRPLIDRRRHTLSVTLPERPCTLLGDPARLTQIVANLVNNAAKYQDEGGRIDLSVQAEADQLVLSVRDRGVGIIPELLPSVFDLFSRSNRQTGPLDDGLGIGLTLVKKLVELHGGTVEALSEGTGQGSEFRVRLPMTPEEHAPVEESAEDPPRIDAPPQNVLIVDDNRDAAESLALLLRMNGHTVTVAHDGGRGLELAMALRPSVVFLDIGLPVLDGYEVCRLARAGGLSEARIIALSGFGQESDRERSKAAGFDLHSVKPVAPAELIRLVASCGAIPCRRA